ncbi:glutamine synthetase [Sinorhizobium meliloti]|uniref:glutamine synthetase n=1 Tax=Rhizobium meliloti TaxID=382 RepID=UPI0013E31817|nr:glutamine synthetase [Sinorhizobium meliloti]
MLRDKLRRVSDLNRYRFGAELEFHLMPPDDSPALRADGQAYAFGSASNLAICIDAMMNALDRVGIPWNNFSQENHFNQFEFSLQHSTPLEQADRVFLTRFVLRDVAALHGLRCTFTPVVREDGAPSNLHLHVSDPATDCVEALSAGLASVLSGPFLAICPTRNGRLVQRMNSFSSKKIDVGEGDRFKALRIVGGTDERHIELRTPTSDANPYLAILMILGGLQAGDDNPANGADIASNHGIEWDFDRSIEAFQTDPIARRMLDSESIELFTSMKRLEGRKSAELGFEAEVSMLMAVI